MLLLVPSSGFICSWDLSCEANIILLLSVPLPAVVDCGDRGTSQNCVSIFSRSYHMTNSGEGGKGGGNGRTTCEDGRTGERTSLSRIGNPRILGRLPSQFGEEAEARESKGGSLARVVRYDS